MYQAAVVVDTFEYRRHHRFRYHHLRVCRDSDRTRKMWLGSSGTGCVKYRVQFTPTKQFSPVKKEERETSKWASTLDLEPTSTFTHPAYIDISVQAHSF